MTAYENVATFYGGIRGRRYERLASFVNSLTVHILGKLHIFREVGHFGLH